MTINNIRFIKNNLKFYNLKILLINLNKSFYV